MADIFRVWGFGLVCWSPWKEAYTCWSCKFTILVAFHLFEFWIVQVNWFARLTKLEVTMVSQLSCAHFTRIVRSSSGLFMNMELQATLVTLHPKGVQSFPWKQLYVGCNSHAQVCQPLTACLHFIPINWFLGRPGRWLHIRFSLLLGLWISCHDPLKIL